MLIGQFFRENPLTYDGRGRAVCSGPLNSQAQKLSNKKFSHKDADVMEKLKILAEFQGVKEHQAFMGNMQKEREVKQRIKDLMRYRRYGVKTISESAEYETQQKIRRLNRKKNEKIRTNQQKLLQQSCENSRANVESPLIEYSSGYSVGTPSSVGADLNSPASSIKSEDYSSQQQTTILTASPGAQSFTPATQRQTFSPGSGGTGGEHLETFYPLKDSDKAVNSPQTNLQTGGSTTAAFTIISYPGHEILSANEKRLCTNLRLTPAHYISYKTCLLMNHLQKKKGQTPKPPNPTGLDKNDRKVIFNFLMRAGWITAY